jgi:hypothetical protein
MNTATHRAHVRFQNYRKLASNLTSTCDSCENFPKELTDFDALFIGIVYKAHDNNGFYPHQGSKQDEPAIVSGAVENLSRAVW